MDQDRRPTIVIGNILSKLVVPNELEYYYGPMLNEIDTELSFPVIGREHTQMYNKFDRDGNRLWDGRKHLINLTGIPLKKIAWKRYVTEPWMLLTGNVPRIIRVMAKYNVFPMIEHATEYSANEDIDLNLNWNEDYKIREYQQRCIDVALSKKRGLLQIATGGGKTIVAANIIKQLGIYPVLFLVTTKDLLYQAKSCFETSLDMEGEVGIIGDSKCEIKKINVATIQTVMRCLGKADEFSASIKEISEWMDGGLGDMEEGEVDQDQMKMVMHLLHEVRLLFFDECQHAPAETCRNVLFECQNALYKFGLSATPFREDGEDITIEGLFGENLINVDSSHLIQNGYLVKPKIFMWKVNNRCRSKSYQTEYKEEIVENEDRNRWISHWANVFSEADKSILILVRQIKHGKLLQELLPDAVFIDGTKSSKKRNEAIENLRNRTLKIMIATTLADEGLDIPSLDVLILAGSGKSKTKALQRIGRVIRPFEGKTEAIVIDFMDECKYCKKHALARKRTYKSEELFDVEVVDENYFLREDPSKVAKIVKFEKESKSDII